MPGCAQYPRSYPQFKKVFSPSAVKIHTGCAERIRSKNFVRTLKLQNAVSGHPVGFFSWKRDRYYGKM
jgi:hypothetical protein